MSAQRRRRRRHHGRRRRQRHLLRRQRRRRGERGRGQGTDTVMASVNYTLTAGSEIEFLRANAGTTGLSLTGNALANRSSAAPATTRSTAAPATTRSPAGPATTSSGSWRDLARIPSPTSPPAGAAGSQDLMDISGLGITAATFAAYVHIADGGGAPQSSRSRQQTRSRLLNVALASIDMTDFRLA